MPYKFTKLLSKILKCMKYQYPVIPIDPFFRSLDFSPSIFLIFTVHFSFIAQSFKISAVSLFNHLWMCHNCAQFFVRCWGFKIVSIPRTCHCCGQFKYRRQRKNTHGRKTDRSLFRAISDDTYQQRLWKKNQWIY